MRTYFAHTLDDDDDRVFDFGAQHPWRAFCEAFASSRRHDLPSSQASI